MVGIRVAWTLALAAALAGCAGDGGEVDDGAARPAEDGAGNPKSTDPDCDAMDGGLARAAAIVLVAAVAGCADSPPADEAAPPAAAVPSSLWLACGGGEGAVQALETSLMGSCWGHIGHHTYFVGEPRVLHGLAGTVFAVEVSWTQPAGDPVLPVDASLDGAAWTRVGTIPYPLGQDPEDRYRINVSIETPPVPFRFLRVSMPPSAYEGLAGYLDNSNLTARVTPFTGAAAPLPARPSGDCSEGVLESFFPDHPCWFGGYDNLDRAQGGAPSGVHASWDLTDESWFDSPSFLHTYVLGPGDGGTLDATVRVQLWRLAHYAICSGSEPAAAPAQPIAIAQASADGVAWTEVGRAAGLYDQDILVTGTVPDGSRLLRFSAQNGASFDAGGCHHPLAFVVDSSYSVA